MCVYKGKTKKIIFERTQNERFWCNERRKIINKIKIKEKKMTQIELCGLWRKKKTKRKKLIHFFFHLYNFLATYYVQKTQWAIADQLVQNKKK